MSSPQANYTYVYIPNLVGRQMLRIPIDEVEAEGKISLAHIKPAESQASTITSAYSRDSSRSPSISSVSSAEYEE